MRATIPAPSRRSTARWAVVNATPRRSATPRTDQNGFSAKRSSARAGCGDRPAARSRFHAPRRSSRRWSRANRVLGEAHDASQEVAQPLLPLASLRHGQEARVVLVARGLEPGAEVEQRRREHPARASESVMSRRPTRPLPSRNGWIASNWTCAMAAWTSGGSDSSCMKRSHASRHCISSVGGGGT